MRYFLILLLLISSLANAQSNRQRLDDIEFELQKQKIERDNKEFDRQMNEQRRLREKNRDSPFIILDGEFIDVDKHLRNTLPRENICSLTWNGKQFIKDSLVKDNLTEIHIDGVPPLKLFFQNKRNNEIEKILQNTVNQRQMIKLCPILKNYSSILIH